MPRDTKVNKVALPSGAIWSSQEDRHVSRPLKLKLDVWAVSAEMFHN